MFKKMVESLEKASVREKIKNGGLVCPDCGASSVDLPKEWDEVMVCHACGSRASLAEWVKDDRSGPMKGKADHPPFGTKIRREEISPKEVTWHIPAVGKFGFFLFFAIFWLAITGLVSGGFLLAFLSGQEIEGDGPDWIVIPFFAVFWAIGLGMLYASIRQKYMKLTVSINSDQITLRKELFGKRSEKSLFRSAITSIEQKEFYQQNYQPVYGIEIRGTDGKLRFGTGLSEAEKAWLVADFKKVTASASSKEEPAEEVHGLAPIRVGARKSVFSISIPKPGVSMIITSLILMLFGIGFVCIGIFVIEGKPMPAGKDGAKDIFDRIEFFFDFLDNGFRTVWIIFSSIFALAGLAMAISTLRTRSKDRRIEGSEAEISIRTYRNGLVYEDRSFPRNMVHDIRGTVSGSTNNKTMKRVELIVGNKTEKISSWMDGEAADHLIAEVRAALGK